MKKDPPFAPSDEEMQSLQEMYSRVKRIDPLIKIGELLLEKYQLSDSIPIEKIESATPIGFKPEELLAMCMIIESKNNTNDSIQ